MDDNLYKKWSSVSPFRNRLGHLIHRALDIIATSNVEVIAKFLGLNSMDTNK